MQLRAREDLRQHKRTWSLRAVPTTFTVRGLSPTEARGGLQTAFSTTAQSILRRGSRCRSPRWSAIRLAVESEDRSSRTNCFSFTVMKQIGSLVRAHRCASYLFPPWVKENCVTSTPAET